MLEKDKRLEDMPDDEFNRGDLSGRIALKNQQIHKRKKIDNCKYN